ncbi:hypothetical protein KIN20_027182 [Parelaphostrongylus tenuis]|uniref:Uncharacterized protein n=1 Tax=Parelaphostrongylus tenuis TaxID=148309 RepID=A0AAD5WDR5_PARTN|nr:hypothetical protein KIN20_027182 [Parelaphostrongylus tenuis]
MVHRHAKNYQGVYYKRNSERNGAARRDTTPRLPSDDGGESSERDSVKNDGYQDDSRSHAMHGTVAEQCELVSEVLRTVPELDEFLVRPPVAMDAASQ